MINNSQIIKNKFLSAIKDYSMLDGADNIIVGFSGGADSVCLLHLLKSYEDEFSFKVSAAHINHGIRGDEAKRDEAFCIDFCEKYNIPFYIKAIDCISLAREHGDTVEERGRKERYAFFDSLCSGDNYKIATAHNSNDNAETVIFNLCRGMAIKGAGGIPPVRDNIIRPLIYCTRDEIEDYCRENGLSYMTDSTNLSDDYTRNNIRHNVLPVLEKVNSAYLDKITEFSDYASKLSSYLKETAEKELDNAMLGDGSYDTDYLLSLPEVACFECIITAFSRFTDMSLTRQKIDEIYNLLSEKGRIQIYGNIYCEALKNRFRFFEHNDRTDNKISVNLSNQGSSYLFNGYTVNFTPYCNCSKNINKNILDNLIDCDKIVGNLYISTRSQGDNFTFYNRKVTKSLKKLFNEIGIPLEKRDILPVLYDDNGVVWVFGVGTNSRCRVNNDATNIIFVTGEE